MHEKKSRITQRKSFSSFHDLFGFWRPLYYVSKNRGKMNRLTMGPNCKECDRTYPNKLITVEQLQTLSGRPSLNPVARSTSTIFYDLDILAKRHSFHCLTEDKNSNSSYLKSLYWPNHTRINRHARQSFIKTSHPSAEIQQTKDLPRDSMEFNSKKLNKFQASEIVLKDIQMEGFQSTEFEAYKLVQGPHHQIWSDSKGEDQNNESNIDDNQISVKGSSIMDNPCPCELFSYACPCHKMSVTDLGRNNITRPTVNQLTSTLRFQYGMTKGFPEFSTRNANLDENDEEDLFKEDQHSKCTQVNKRMRSPYRKPQKSLHRLTCPKCSHKIEVLSSTDGEDEKKNNPFPSVNISAANASIRTRCKHKKIVDNDFRTFCPHEPMCATIPVCQAAQNNIWSKRPSKCNKCHHDRPGPRVIRITKACRHHPPCTVVPSCQKINVLKNNCEYIPPCFHRPRCVNIPLCVPCSKSVNYDQNLQEELEEHYRSFHMPQCQHTNKAEYNAMDPPYRDIQIPEHRDVQVVSHVQNDPRDVLTPNNATQQSTPSSQKSISPCPTPQTCHLSVFTKSCQYEPEETEIDEDSESDAVIFIRNVGCQFKNRNYDVATNGLINDRNQEINSYYANVHTVRCEDKFTNPKERPNSTTVIKSFSSEDVQRVGRVAKYRPSGECDTPQFITAFTHIDPIQVPFMCPLKNSTDETPKPSLWPLSITSKASSLKCKFQPVFGMKKHKKYRLNSNNVITIYSRKSSHCKS